MAEIRLAKISKRFEGKEVVKALDLRVHKGELMSLLGESGCGKTTTLRMIAGLLMPDMGEIYFDDKGISHLKGRERGAVMVFQDHRLFPHMSVYENIAFGLKIRRRERKMIEKKVAWALEMVKLSGYEKRYPAELSGGQAQRIALARALVLEPAVLLLDEPLSNLDAVLRDDMRCLIRSLHKTLNLTIIFVTHDQKEAMVMSDRIAVMREGVIEQVASPTEIYYRPASPWVGNFVGQANMLRGRVTEDGMLESLIGRWPLAEFAPEQWPGRVGAANTRAVCTGGTGVEGGVGADVIHSATATAEVQILLRPEEVSIVSIHEQGHTGDEWVEGEIFEQTFTGETWFYEVALGKEHIMAMSAGNGRFKPGDRVKVRANRDALCLYT